MVEDFGDGVKLVHFVECLTGKTIQHYHPNPTLMAHRLENSVLALALLKEDGLKLTVEPSGAHFNFLVELCQVCLLAALPVFGLSLLFEDAFNYFQFSTVEQAFPCTRPHFSPMS